MCKLSDKLCRFFFKLHGKSDYDRCRTVFCRNIWYGPLPEHYIPSKANRLNSLGVDNWRRVNMNKWFGLELSNTLNLQVWIHTGSFQIKVAISRPFRGNFCRKVHVDNANFVYLSFLTHLNNHLLIFTELNYIKHVLF